MRVSHPTPGSLVLEYGQPRVLPVLIAGLFLVCASFFTLVGEATFLRSDGTTCQAVRAGVWSESVIPLDGLREASVTEVPGSKGRTDYAVVLTTADRGPTIWLRAGSPDTAREIGQEVEAFVKAHEAGIKDYGDTRWLGWMMAGFMALFGVAIALRLTQRVTTTFDRAHHRVTIASSWPWTTNRYELKLTDVEKVRTFSYRGSTRIDLSLKKGLGGYYLGSVTNLAAPEVLEAIAGFIPA